MFPYIAYLIGVYLILLHWQILLKTSESESAIWQNTLIFMMQSLLNMLCSQSILFQWYFNWKTRIFFNYKSLFIMFQYIWGYLTLLKSVFHHLKWMVILCILWLLLWNVLKSLWETHLLVHKLTIYPWFSISQLFSDPAGENGASDHLIK